MKRFFTLLIVCLPALVACDKQVTEEKSFSEQITGKWKFSQSFYSIGGPLIYVSTENLNQWIDFKADGGFSSNMPDFKNITNYELLDSSKVRFISSPSQAGVRYFIFLDSVHSSLTLSPADLRCIEGCGNKFKR